MRGDNPPLRFLEYPTIRTAAETVRVASEEVLELHTLLALNLVRWPCPAPEDPQRTHPWARHSQEGGS
jgi:hypothetical protein